MLLVLLVFRSLRAVGKPAGTAYRVFVVLSVCWPDCAGAGVQNCLHWVSYYNGPAALAEKLLQSGCDYLYFDQVRPRDRSSALVCSRLLSSARVCSCRPPACVSPVVAADGARGRGV